jgi:hypothetical protein
MSEIDYQGPPPDVALPDPSLANIRDIERALKENARNVLIKDMLIRQVQEQATHAVLFCF